MPPLHLQAGDIILFPHGDAHTMASSADQRRAAARCAQALLRERPDELQLGGGGEPTRFICGYLSCDPDPVPAGPGGAAQGGDGQAQEGREDRLGRAFLRLRGGGGRFDANPAAKACWPSCPRCWWSRHCAGTSPRCPRARPAGSRACAIASSASASPSCTRSRRIPGRSKAWRARPEPRARFSPRDSPTMSASRPSSISASGAWRSHRTCCGAARSSMIHIALEVGYETDAAFSRAFRREFGMPPAAWRREHSGAGLCDHQRRTRSERSAHRSRETE